MKHPILIMSELDGFVAQFLRQYGIYIIGAYFLARLIASAVRKIYPHVYAWALNWLSPRYNRALRKEKVKLFQDLHDVKKQRESEDSNHVFTILEIGVGSGPNFPFYPDGTSVIAIEPKEQFKSYLEANAEMVPGIKITEVVWANAENMVQVPDNSIPAVVCTITLCSVIDVDLVLQEVRRVLMPVSIFIQV